jgi:pimeloyl-ACP methyl ester carboxylesterase
VRAILALALIVLAGGCHGGVPPAELARTTPYELARKEGHYVTVDGLQVFAITAGHGRDVVLIHGNPSNTYSWRKVVTPLAKHYRVHAIDLPGYGFSDKPNDDSRYTTEALAHDVVHYLDAVGVERAVLVGNSMGGHVASETAILHRDRVSALVLVDSSGLPGLGRYPLMTRMAGWPVIGPLLRALPARGRVRDGLRSAVYDPSQITDADIDAYYAPLRSAGGMNAFIARMRQPVADERVARVHTIAAPTLVITGDSDRLVPRSMAERYHELIAGSELLVMPQTGHLPQEERPDETVAAITRWIDAHP